MTTRIGDVAILKDGSSINGVVEVPVFTINTKYGALRVKKRDILTIHYKNPPQFLVDEMQIDAGTRLEGDIVPSEVAIRVAGVNQTLQVDKRYIGTLVFVMGVKHNLSAVLKKRMKSIRTAGGWVASG